MKQEQRHLKKDPVQFIPPPKAPRPRGMTKLQGIFGKHLAAWAALAAALLTGAVTLVGVAVTQYTNMSIEEQRAVSQAQAVQEEAQEEALREYLAATSQLIREDDLRDAEQGSDIRILARGQTLSLMRRMSGGERKRGVIQFLYDSGLVSRSPVGQHNPDDPVITLERADLREANLQETDLSSIDLSDADLSRASLSNTDLSEADLSEADLLGTDLTNADLRGARGLTDEQLATAKTLEGAIMPDGSKHD